MKTPIRPSRHACLWIFLAVASDGQTVAPDLSHSLPAKQVVTEGRNVSFRAAGADVAGTFQWQIAPRGTEAWVDLSDEGVHTGTRTRSLELAKVELSMDGDRYRFTVTDGPVRHASNALRLTVSPLMLRSPVALAMNEQGVLFVSDAESHAIWRIFNAREFGWGNEVNCPVGLVAGHLGHAGAEDGFAETATFNRPAGIAGEGGGRFLIVDSANAIVRRLGASSLVETVAGASGLRGNEDGAALTATFGAPAGIARGPDGSFYVADAGNHTIRRIDAGGIVSTLAGSPGNAGYADGRGGDARFNHPGGVAVGADGRIYVADTANNLIRTVSPDGEVRTLAGVAGVAGSEDDEGTSARFNGPTAVVVTRSGSLVYVADTGNSTIRTIGESGKVSTYAGVPGVGGLRDGHLYYDAANRRYVTQDMLLNQPRGLYDDGQGLLFIADTGNAAIRVIAVYEGLAATLPLVPASALWSPPVAPPAPPPAPPPPAPPRTATPPPSQAGSGGGAVGLGFVTFLIGLRFLAVRASGRRRPCG